MDIRDRMYEYEKFHYIKDQAHPKRWHREVTCTTDLKPAEFIKFREQKVLECVLLFKLSYNDVTKFLQGTIEHVWHSDL